MNRAQKNEMATALKDKFSRAKVAVFADYKGLGATEADELRAKVRDNEAEIKVLKNNIARLITKTGEMGDDAKGLMDELVGPTLVAFAYNDPAAVAKAMHEFAKDHEALEIKDSLMGEKRVKASEIEALASLPSKEVLLAMLLSALQGPTRGLVGVMAGVPRAFLTALTQIQKKKEETA